MSLEESLATLRRLPGIGPFSATLVVLRGAGAPDGLPLSEPHLARAIALAYKLAKPPDEETIAELAEAWRPHLGVPAPADPIWKQRQLRSAASCGRSKHRPAERRG